MNTKQKEIPAADWANWALIKAWKDGGTPEEKATIAEFIAARFESIASQNVPRQFVITTNCGHWARGVNLEEAALAAIKAGASKTSKAFVTLVLNDATPEVSGDGRLISDSVSTQFNIGWAGTVGSIIKANKQ